MVFNGGLKLTTRQVGGVRYIEDKDGKRFQLREMAALAADKPKHLIVTLGVVSGRTELVDVLRDSGCSTMVIRKDLCDADDFTSEARGCIMMDRRVVVLAKLLKSLFLNVFLVILILARINLDSKGIMAQINVYMFLRR